MNEFIFWNKHYEKFFDDLTISGINVNEALEENEDWIALPYIQKDDINNNKIYADCSIVKLGNDIGFIKYSPFLSANVFISLSYHKTEQPLMECSLFDINNMEIIDTIQENKLGLIKE